VEVQRKEPFSHEILPQKGGEPVLLMGTSFIVPNFELQAPRIGLNDIPRPGAFYRSNPLELSQPELDEY